MRRLSIAVCVAILLLALPAWGKEKEPKFKTVEPKHFSRAEGVELPPEFPDFLYAELKNELQKSGLFEQVVGEGEVVEAADAERSVVLEGNLLEYKKGSVVKESLIGFGAGLRSLRAQIVVHRRSNNEPLIDKELKVSASSKWDPKHLARFLAKKITDEVKRDLQR